MKIDRNKHNIYVANTLLKTPEQTTSTGTSTGAGSTTIIYTGGGGSGTGLTPEQSEKLDSVESGAQVNQNAFSYLTISNGEQESTQAARVQTDIAKLTILGEGVTVELVTEVESPERTITSTGIVGEYKVSYHKVETEVEVPSEEGEPTTEVQITWPLTITYVSGTKIKQEDFDTLKVVYNGVDTILTDYQVTTDTEGITSITKNQEGLLFDRIVFTKAGVDEEGQPVTNEVMVINAYTTSYSTIKLTSGDTYWKLDEDGNLYTTYNAYSTQELSAYGIGESGGGGTGGESYLKDLKDVDVTNLINGGILQYNSTTKMWEVVDGSSLEVDMTEIEQKITDIENTITEWTPIIEAIDNITDWFSFVDGKIRANYDLWGVGEISAYGIGEGGGSTGTSWLRDLEDVTLDPVVGTGDILAYNGSVWVNIDKSEVGLNETELHNYLTQNKYVTDSDLNDYVTQSAFNTLQTTVNNHTTQINTIQEAIDLLNDMFEWDDGKIKAKADLYSVGEISAYGIGEGSASQGAGYLHELDDVSIVPNELTAGQLLQYDGSFWVAIDKDEVGLNETELHTYLTQNNYTTTEDLTWNNIQNKPETFHTTLSYINDLNENWDSLLNTNPTDYVTRWPTFAEVTDKPTTAEGYGITDVYTMTASDDRYVNVTGDTMTGNLILPTLQANTSVIIGSVRLEYDSTNNALKVVSTSGGLVNLYATGEVSAYGYDTEESVTVAELDDLTDVTINNPTTGQALVFNGSIWVNQTIETGGLDESELESYLQSNNYVQTSDLSTYATMTWVNNNFLQSSDLSGYAKSVRVNNSTYSANSSGQITIPDYITRYSVDSDGTQVISTGLRLKDSSNYGQYLYFGDNSYVYLAELTDDDLTIHATDLNLEVSRLLVNGEELALDINISNSGSGNVVTNISASSNTLTVTKGFTLNTGTSGRLAYYSSSSTIDDYTSSIGSSTRLWYLSSGTPTNSSSTVGSNYEPVWLSSGTITACSQDFLVERGIWKDTSSGNWNSIMTPGMYSLSEWGTNGPTNAGYAHGTAVVFKSGTSSYGGAVTQLYLPHINAGNGAYAAWRSTYGLSSSRWQTWHYLLDTGNAQNFLGNYYVKKTGDSMTGTLTNTADFTAGAGFYLTSSHGRFFWDSDTAATWLQANTGGTLRFSGLNNTRLTRLGINTAKVDVNGPIYIESSGFSNCLSIRRTDSTQNASIVFRNSSNTILGHLGLLGSGSAPNVGPAWWNSNQTQYNIASESNHRFFYSRYVDLRSYSTSNFYPYVFTSDDGYNTDIEVAISSDPGSSSAAYNANHLHFFIRTGGWSDNGFYLFILNHHTYSSNEITIGSIGTGTQNGGFAVWLRGGVGYIVRATGRWTQSDIHTSSYSFGGSTYTVGTKYSGGSNSNVTVQWSPVGLSNAARAYIHESILCQTIMPRTNNSYECGGASNRWNYVYTNRVLSTYSFNIESQGSAANALHGYQQGGTTILRYTAGSANTYATIVSANGSTGQIILRPRGTTDASHYCEVTATGNFISTGEITAYQSSDIRLKTNITDLKGIDLIRKLRPVEYDWTDEAMQLKAPGPKHAYGLIAQEVEQIVPDVVNHNMFAQGYLGIDYTRLIPLTISAIKEVDDEVTKLKKEVKELKKRLNKYERLNRQGTTRIDISDVSIVA